MGLTEVSADTAVRISSTPMPRAANASRSNFMRTARFCAPLILICATPGRVDIRGLITLSANSFITWACAVSDVNARKMTGLSAGFTLRKLGGAEISAGNRDVATEIADCTSSAAASMLRLRSNSNVIEVAPSTLDEVMSLMPAMVAN